MTWTEDISTGGKFLAEARVVVSSSSPTKRFSVPGRVVNTNDPGVTGFTFIVEDNGNGQGVDAISASFGAASPNRCLDYGPTIPPALNPVLDGEIMVQDPFVSLAQS
jgi:hypothetical protein